MVNSSCFNITHNFRIFEKLNMIFCQKIKNKNNNFSVFSFQKRKH